VRESKVERECVYATERERVCVLERESTIEVRERESESD